MRLQKTLSGMLVLAMVAAGAPARVNAGSADKAADVLAAARKAIGAGKLDSLRTFSVEARTERNLGEMQMTADLELLLELPDKYARFETASGGPMSFSSTTGFNGDKPLSGGGGAMRPGGMVIRMGPGGPLPEEKMTPEQKAEMGRMSVRMARHDLSRLMLGWFATAHPSLGVTYAYAGEAESPDGKADVIDVKDADGFNARLFIDQQTHLPLMLTYQGPQRRIVTARAGGPAPDVQKEMEHAQKQAPSMVEYRLYFSGWAEMDGIKVPMRMQRAAAGTTEEEWTVTKVKVNPKIDAKKFQSQS